MLLKFKAEAKSLRPRLKGPEAKDEAEARGYETEAKILTSRPVWPRGFHISDAWTYVSLGSYELLPPPECFSNWFSDLFNDFSCSSVVFFICVDSFDELSQLRSSNLLTYSLCPVVPMSRANVGVLFASHEYWTHFDEILGEIITTINRWTY